MKRLLAGFAAGPVLILLLVLSVGMAHAQGRNCAPRDTVVERLADTYGESRQSVGLGSQGSVVETFASEETGSWTITVTLPSGLTCLIASAQAFERLSEALPMRGSDL